MDSPFQYFQKSFPIGLDPSQSYTIIYASDGQIVLAGNNEDRYRPINLRGDLIVY